MFAQNGSSYLVVLCLHHEFVAGILVICHGCCGLMPRIQLIECRGCLPQVWNKILISCFLNWIVGPLLMTGLAWATLPDLPGYRTGIIIIGLARCIAMVLIWNQLAGGSAELCAFLVCRLGNLRACMYSWETSRIAPLVLGLLLHWQTRDMRIGSLRGTYF
jgi:Sodium Bile acid symporter family